MRPFALFCVFSVALSNSAAQEQRVLQPEMRVIYNMTYQRDSADSNSARIDHMELLFNDSLSLFGSVIKGRIDSVAYLKMNGNPGASLDGPWPFTEFHYQILKERGQVITFDELTNGKRYNGSNDFYYRESADALKWELKDDTVQIHDLPCQRAELAFGNRIWIAWFTERIPVSEGPYKFHGLPGLIVRMHDEKKHWVFDLLSISHESGPVAINFDKSKRPIETTKEQFFRNKKKFLENELYYLELSGNISFPTANDRRIIQQNVNDANRKYNNWIELYR